MSGYIGNIPVPQATQTRQSFTATASQTTFNTAGYSVGYVDVFLNGVKLAPADYTATNGSDIILAVGAASGDILETVAYEIFQVVDQDFTGDFTVDGTTFVVDSTNNRVGVGTSSPSDDLHIASSLATIRLEDSDVAGGASYSLITSSSNGNIAFSADPDNVRSSTDIRFSVDGSERMRIDSSGNVGIGTTSPSSYNSGSNNLVVGGSSGDNGITIATGTTNGGLLAFADGTTGNAAYRGYIQYDHNTDFLAVGSAATERMRIDSSGNLLVGKTDGSIAVAGFAVQPSGQTKITQSSADVLRLNRLTSDGTIIDLRKDGTTVGSIGVTDGDNLVISSTATDHAGLKFNNTAMGPWVNNTNSNGAMDIGTPVARFKDLYLSGGVYLGGVGAANHLDDYEEGTWTPTMHTSDANLTATIGIQFARYVKIGQLVYVSAYIVPSITAGSSGYAYLSSLPFAVTSATGAVFPWFCVHGTALSSSGGYLGGNGRMVAIANNSTSGINWNAGIQYLMFNCSYMTDA